MIHSLRTVLRAALLTLLICGVSACDASDVPPPVAPPDAEAIATDVGATEAGPDRPSDEQGDEASQSASGGEPSSDDAAMTSGDATEPSSASADAPAWRERVLAQFTEPPITEGEVLLLYGRVLDTAGEPVPGAVVEIWQTDAAGVYEHPAEPDTDARDPTFQFFGSATADDDGAYAFRTLLPGQYEPRPRHIHYKVKLDDATLLTSQLYFAEDRSEVTREGMVQAVGADADRLIVELVPDGDALLAEGTIVVDAGTGDGELPLTPAQGEGPYYPVTPPSERDNDLLR